MTLSVPFSDDLSVDSSSGASGPSLSGLRPDSTSSAVFEESLDDSSFDRPADGSLVSSSFPYGTFEVTLVESSDDSSTLPSLAPCASGPSVVASLPGSASLPLSGESSDNLTSGHTSAFDLSETWS